MKQQRESGMSVGHVGHVMSKIGFGVVRTKCEYATNQQLEDKKQLPLFLAWAAAAHGCLHRAQAMRATRHGSRKTFYDAAS